MVPTACVTSTLREVLPQVDSPTISLVSVEIITFVKNFIILTTEVSVGKMYN